MGPDLEKRALDGGVGVEYDRYKKKLMWITRFCGRVEIFKRSEHVLNVVRCTAPPRKTRNLLI